MYEIYYKRNKMQQIKGFITVVQSKTVTKASEVMKVSISSVANQVKSLESHLGVELFKKSGRNIVLTDEGQRFYETVLPIYNSTEDVFNMFADGEIKDKNIIRIGSNHVGISYILPKTIQQFKEKFPQTKFFIHNIAREEADAQLLHKKIDIAIYPTTTQSSEFEYKPIKVHNPILLLRKDDEILKKTGEITLEDIKDRELVKIDPKFITLPNFEQVIKRYGLKSSITFENADWEILKQFVRAKIGVALISDICIQGHDPDLVVIPMTRYFGEMIYSVYTRRVVKIRDIIDNFINELIIHN